MGREGGAKEWVGIQRAMEATVVVMVATLVLLFAAAGQALPSHHHICPTHKHSIKLHLNEKAYFGTNSSTMRVRMEAPLCINSTRVLNLSEVSVSNETTPSEKNLKWYEFTFIHCQKFIAKIGAIIVKFSHEGLPQYCRKMPVTLSVESSVQVGRNCRPLMSQREVDQNTAECKWILKGTPNTGHIIFKKPGTPSIVDLFDLIDKQSNYDSSNLFFDDLQAPVEPAGASNDDKNIFGKYFDSHQEPKEPDVDESETFLNWPKINYEDILPATPASPSTYKLDDNSYFDGDTSYTKRRNYKENAIPIFIGIVAFTVSMCLRFCLCRGKSVVRRVTTVTVIRSRPVSPPDATQDQQDPPPSYIDVVNEATSPQSPADEGSAEPPPPAYTDIVNEVQPPTYSEVEAQSIPTSEEVPLADQDVEEHATEPPPDPDPAPDAKESAPSKNMLSKYRSQQKQFAFKVLEEDE